MKAVLALDLGTKLGWAIRHADGRIESGAHDFTPSRGQGDGMRFLRFRSWLHDTKRRLDAAGGEISLIRYERVDFMLEGQVLAAHVWGGNWATLTAWAEHHQIPYCGVAVSTIKKAVAGSGKATTPEVVDAIKRLGFHPRTSDEAVAIALLHTPPKNIAA